MTVANEQFFMVYNTITRQPPTKRHRTYLEAEFEAKRLAAKQRGDQFVILQAIAYAKAIEPVTVTSLLPVPWTITYGANYTSDDTRTVSIGTNGGADGASNKI